MKIKLYLRHALEVFLQTLGSNSLAVHQINLIDYDQYFLEMEWNGMKKYNALYIPRVRIVIINFYFSCVCVCKCVEGVCMPVCAKICG